MYRPTQASILPLVLHNPPVLSCPLSFLVLSSASATLSCVNLYNFIIECWIAAQQCTIATDRHLSIFYNLHVRMYVEYFANFGYISFRI